MHFLHGRVQLRKDLQALAGDIGFHDAAVFLFAGTGDQAARFQAIEQARDVGIARDQPAADFAAGQARGARAAQDTQNVILGAGQARSLEEGLGSAGESIGGAPESEEDLLFEVRLGRPAASGRWASGGWAFGCEALGGHELEYSRYNDNCQADGARR
jgi:hypothetical protein